MQQLAQCEACTGLCGVDLQRAAVALAGLELLTLRAEVVAEVRERRRLCRAIDARCV